jgi:ATP-dependent Clp protease ATP-binding subunit ClpC
MKLPKWLAAFFKRTPNPLDNFTPRMQQVLKLARKAADDHCHLYVGTEHVLLGLLDLGEGMGFCALCRLGVDLARLRDDLERTMAVRSKQKRLPMIPYTPVVKRVLLKYGNREAKGLGNG